MTEVITITIAKPMPVAEIPSPPSCPYVDSERDFSAERIMRQYLEKLDAWKVAADASHAANSEAVAHNALNAKALSGFLKNIGLTGHREQVRNSRSRYPKYIDMDAGYISDVNRAYRCQDNYTQAVYSFESNKRSAAEKLSKLTQKNELREKEAENERKANASLIALGKMAGKYGVEVSDWEDMINHLRGLSKYLDLAAGMEATRCSWADGPGKASRAFGRFLVESDQDKAIAECVGSCFDDFCDGRVFRDCEWNYGEIYGLVDESLLKDFRAAQEAYPDWWE